MLLCFTISFAPIPFQFANWITNGGCYLCRYGVSHANEYESGDITTDRIWINVWLARTVRVAYISVCAISSFIDVESSGVEYVVCNLSLFRITLSICTDRRRDVRGAPGPTAGCWHCIKTRSVTVCALPGSDLDLFRAPTQASYWNLIFVNPWNESDC